MSDKLEILILTPPGRPEPSLAIAGARAGLIGVFNGEFDIGQEALADGLAQLAHGARQPFGLKVDALDGVTGTLVRRHVADGGLRWLVVGADWAATAPTEIAEARAAGCRVLVEIVDWSGGGAGLPPHDGLIVKGHEAGGRVGEETTFILLQKALASQSGPVLVRGGIGPNAVAAVRASGAAGIVLDDQLLLLAESPVRDRAARYLRDFSGHETGLLNGRRESWRLLEMPGYRPVKELREVQSTLTDEALAQAVAHGIGWDDPARELVPLGQAAAFALEFAQRYHGVARLARELVARTERQVLSAAGQRALAQGQGVAAVHGTSYPVVQGPMTRVSDSAAFAQAVADGGGLPMMALALMRPAEVERLLAEVVERTPNKPWGVGLLGFAPADLIRGQIDVVRRFNPRFALIAGGRPGQAHALEEEGIAAYLHVPSTGLLKQFLEQGARRFVFEGRECGGHIGPLSSLVLWDRMVSVLAQQPELEGCQVLFAGGIHDARSAAMVSAIAEPLVARGVKIGVLMGTAYLFTKEIVASGAVVPTFQSAALACDRTVSLETGPGHASRCMLTPFTEQFLAARRQLESEGKGGEELRLALEELTLGRLRVATKGVERAGDALQAVAEERQELEGMYMIGQAATAIDHLTTVADLHRMVGEGSAEFLEALVASTAAPTKDVAEARPAEIAIIGLGAVFPKAGDVRQYWENILDNVDGITEIPPDRWDWRLYFDEDPNAPDKIYSRWGGFLDDMAFDPVRYGIPPSTIKSIDPLQLMTLEVIERCIRDAGYADRVFDRSRVSVILGASGGAGDVGAQYAVRAETTRFHGALDPDAAERLPKWTEDSFAGILLNVAAGRSANRFDFGGVNFTVDAACASSLAAVYQGVVELEAGRSDLAIVGGVDTVQGPFGYLCFSKTHALSPRGRCRTFDSSADGIVISEGIGVLALKRRTDAERDGDRIYAVIKGVGGSSDGRAKSMTAPSPDGQIRALRRAYDMAGYSPSSVGLFEAHGTGTVAGDTAELTTLTRLLEADGAAPRQSAIGSVKTLIGHTKAAAGAAGLIKAVLACHHKVLPPHGYVNVPNAKLVDDRSPLYLFGQAAPWLSGDVPRRAGVSAFGFGGTNFHVTLEEYDDGCLALPEVGGRNAWPYELLVWRAADRAALSAKVRSVATQLQNGARPALRDLALTLAETLPRRGETAALVVGRDEPMAERVAALADFLADPAAKEPSGAFYAAQPLLADAGRVALVFAGQGTQYPDMFRELAVLFPEMRASLERADTLLADHMEAKGAPGGRLSRAIFPVAAYDETSRKAAAARLTATDLAQPALGAVEAGLWAILCRVGLRAHMSAGHSYGEYPALYAAGVLSFADLMLASEARGRFMVEAAAGGDLGTMAALQCERATADAVAAAHSEVVVANHNAPAQAILSGPRPAIEAVVAEMVAKGMTAQTLPVGAAFHSPLVAPARDRLAEFIGELTLRPAAFPVYANVTGAAYPGEPEAMRALLVDQLTSTVEFVAEVEAMYAAGARVFVCVGPKRVQANLIGQTLGDRPHRAIALDDERGGLKGLLQGLAALLAEGGDLALANLFSGRDCRQLELDDLAGDPRQVPLSPHHWLLNGSGARKASDPPAQPLTIEDVAARGRVAARAGKSGGVPPVGTALQHVDSGRWESLSPARSAIGGVMSAVNDDSHDDQDPHGGLAQGEYAAVGEREVVLAEHQATMRQFLHMQENVMIAYLTGSAGAPADRWTRRIAARLSPRAPAALPLAARAKANGRGNGVAMREEAHPAPASGANRPNGGNGHAAAAPPAPEPPPAPVAAVAADAVTKAALSRDGISEILQTLVEERTGYPRDMLGMDQDIEADLGIDSIKRVEIVGGLLKAMPDEIRAAAAEIGESLNGEKTLGGIVNSLWQRVGGAQEVPSSPFDAAGSDDRPETACSVLPRFLMQAHAEALPAGPSRLPEGLYIVTDDCGGVAHELERRILAKGGSCVLLPAGALADAVSLERALAEVPQVRVAGFAHLAPLAAGRLEPASPDASWHAELHRNEASAFTIVRRYAGDLRKGGRILLASGLGGKFARGGGAAGAFTLQGGSVGLAKSIKQEWPDCAVKAVDLDPAHDAAVNADHLVSEIAQLAGRIEIGYPAGVRTVFRTVAAPLDPVVTARDALAPGAVVLATGGARGITAATLRAMAAPGMTFVLVGRSPPPGPEEEDEESAAADTAAALRRVLIARARQAGRAVKPTAIEAEVKATLDNRDMRANLDAFARAGATVEYRSGDMRDGSFVAALLDDIYARHGRLDGVIHGVGVIEDRLLVDKTLESWERVVRTKVDSTRLLARHLRPDGLAFFAVFTSVAGRYGNSGQSDYATANEIVNRLAWQMHRAWGGKVKVAAINWGPWLAAGAGGGMVSEETRRKFESKGVRLIAPAEGAAFLRDEILRSPLDQVEVIAGEGPWERHEAEVGALPLLSAAEGVLPGLPLMAGTQPVNARKRGVALRRVLDPQSDLFLDQHRLDGTPILPVAVALELIAEAAATVWPDWQVAEVSDLRVLKGIRLEGGASQEIKIVLLGGEHGDATGFVAKAEIRGTAAKEPIHYRAQVRLVDQLPVGETANWRLEPALSPIAATDAYRTMLFHGPCFQTVTRLIGLDVTGVTAEVAATSTDRFLSGAPSGQGWLFHPGLIDAAPQLAWVWSRQLHAAAALPSRLGAVRRYGGTGGPIRRVYVALDPHAADGEVRADVLYVDAEDRVRLMIEGLECTPSSALNRFCGYQGEVCV